MIKVLFLSLLTVSAFNVNCQTIKFENQSPYITKEDKQDKTINIPFSLKNANINSIITLTFSVDEDQSSATKDKDFSITTVSPIILDSANNHSSKIVLVIKPDNFVENTEEINLKIAFKDEKKKDYEVHYSVLIEDLNDGSEDTPHYTEQEKNNNRTVSFDLFTGGNFDFFNALTIQHLGGELVVQAKDIFGKESRWGFYTGLSNFQNFSYDSSNFHVRTQYVRIITGAYVSGVTKYIQRRFVDHQKISTNQWGYYFNPTYRLNSNKSDLFNIYVSLHLEILQTSAKSGYKTDTISFSDTVNYPLKSPVFQSGKGFLLQNYTDVNTNGYFGVAFPMWLNAKDKLKFYFDPGFGYVSYSYSTFQIASSGARLNSLSINQIKPYYLFRFRASEQFTGLNITIGGEIRGLLPTYIPSINIYLGLRADLVKWFKK